MSVRLYHDDYACDVWRCCGDEHVEKRKEEEGERVRERSKEEQVEGEDIISLLALYRRLARVSTPLYPSRWFEGGMAVCACSC